MEQYARLPEETTEELIFRICSDKDIIGSWQEVADILNNLLGEKYTESKYRKQYQMFCRMFEANSQKLFGDGKYLEELQEERKKIERERIKLQTANIEARRNTRQEARQELYYDSVGRYVKTFPSTPPLSLVFSDNEPNLDDKYYLCCLSDIHYGASFESENNIYSPEIAKKRFAELEEKLKNFIRSNHISKIGIVCLGDTIQGILRVSDLTLNESSTVKATVEISRLLASFITNISEIAEIDYFHVPTANHTQIRFLNTKPGELPAEDVEYVIMNYMKDLCSGNTNIHFHFPEQHASDLAIQIFDHSVVLAHGHQYKNLQTVLRDINTMKEVDCLILGHYHRSEEITSHENGFKDSELLLCPSFVGSDPYSDSIMRGSNPAVKIFGFDKTYGHTESHKIILR